MADTHDTEPCRLCGDQLCVEFTPRDPSVSFFDVFAFFFWRVLPNSTQLISILQNNVDGGGCFCGHSRNDHQAPLAPQGPPLPAKGPCVSTQCPIFLAPVRNSVHHLYENS